MSGGSGWAATVTRQRIRGLELSASKDRRTAKWTAITGGLAGTHGHTNALSSQVGATAALARRLLDLHGMQEVRGSNPLSSTRQNVLIFDRLDPVCSCFL